VFTHVPLLKKEGISGLTPTLVPSAIGKSTCSFLLVFTALITSSFVAGSVMSVISSLLVLASKTS
jgi:hypothetical protein